MAYASDVATWVGHNFLGYDKWALENVWKLAPIDPCRIVDTLVLSRLFDATRVGKAPHSIEAWGAELGHPKVGADITDWSVWTQEMQDRCVSDVEINYLLYKRFEKFINSPQWQSAIETEHYIALLCQELHDNGFAFDLEKAHELKTRIQTEVTSLDEAMKRAFPPKVQLVREISPRLTKHGTIAKNSVPKILGPDLTAFTAEAPFSLIEFVPFNARSHTQRIERLWEAGWQPEVKSKTHAEALKELRKLQRKRAPYSQKAAEKAALEEKLGEYGVSGYGLTGWKSTDEENLRTLPDDAPPQFKQLQRFLLLSNRVSTLDSWFAAYHEETGKIHGHFQGIGAWTHRMAHSAPNLGNIPKYDAKQPDKTPYSDEMRRLWIAGRDRYLVGVDAESIQLRIFGHYINDKDFIHALCAGKKEDQSDPHSLNARALGSVCRSRDDAKTFIYAWLLGAGLQKVAAILGCSVEEARTANDNFLEFYPGLKFLKDSVIPVDAARGYFRGFDGRYVRIWGEDLDERRHFTLAGYLQTGESVIMKRAVQLWKPRLEKEKVPFWPVNFVHDEWQIETPRDMEVAKYVATTVADSIRQVGEDLSLNCPMAGSILNGHGKLAIGDNWMETH
jgi:DNA polymerase I-like protein with 3'-5' exonuclease and polymerase domains